MPRKRPRVWTAHRVLNQTRGWRSTRASGGQDESWCAQTGQREQGQGHAAAVGSRAPVPRVPVPRVRARGAALTWPKAELSIGCSRWRNGSASGAPVGAGFPRPRDRREPRRPRTGASPRSSPSLPRAGGSVSRGLQCAWGSPRRLPRAPSSRGTGRHRGLRELGSPHGGGELGQGPVSRRPRSAGSRAEPWRGARLPPLAAAALSSDVLDSLLAMCELIAAGPALAWPAGGGAGPPEGRERGARREPSPRTRCRRAPSPGRLNAAPSPPPM